MRIQIPLVIEMTDEQVKVYAGENGLPVPVRAKDVIENVRSYVLTSVQDSYSFVGDRADVSIKGR
jgi:hypothetical protein